MENSELTPEPAPRNRIRTWARVLSVLVVLLALIITPPLLNVNRLQRRIAANMSQSLGRPVHLDPNVKLHLLPMPGLTLSNLVVSEDPAFGAEPIIRANTVEATLRPGSLWRRQVEVASIRFVEPSLNLVRNQRGQWNIESLLMHGSQIDTAPTEQRQPGPTPRFPYIDATNARVNIKMGDEKMPFSLIETDFALWLPSPQQWRLRMEGKPTRTDLTLSDPGLIRLDGSLDRSPTKSDVPIEMHASWHDVPLGEATKILAGADAGWRGMLTADADLTGTLGDAKLSTKITVNDLRRADFVTAHPLNLTTECTGSFDAMTEVVSHPECQLPVGNSGSVSALAADIDLTTLHPHGLQIGSPGVPESWLLDWVRIFVEHIPASENPAGTVAGSLVYVDSQDGHEGFWQGEMHGDYNPLPGQSPAGEDGKPNFSIIADEDGFTLASLNLMPADKTGSLILSGTADPRHYALRLDGQATPGQLRSLQGLLPPLGESLKDAVPDIGADSAKPLKVDITCTRAWNEKESCNATSAPETKPTRGRNTH